MNKTSYISVGIDVGSVFSLMSIVDPQENLILKPFKIIHNNPDSLARAVSAIKKAAGIHRNLPLSTLLPPERIRI